MKKIGQQIFTTICFPTWTVLAFILLSLPNMLLPPFWQKSSGGLNPIQVENQLPGTEDWRLSNPAPYDSTTFHYATIEGYAWTTSVQAGNEVQFSVSTSSPSFSADVYRMGWYQGKGGRLIQSISGLVGHSYQVPSPNANTGLVAPRWPVAFTLQTKTQWVSGMYMVKLTASDGKQSYIPFVLRASRPAALAFIHAVNTDEAYNFWGGTSLYTDFTNTLNAKRAFKVSFDRPFQQDTGAGQFFYWEYPMVRWLEQRGYDVSYLSDIDIQNIPHPLQSYRGLLIVGHSEYWSKQMRDALENAIDRGVNLGVFAANDIYWQIRYEPRSWGSVPLTQRIIVCYKNKTLDPLYGKQNNLVNVQFRDAPLYRPEQVLLGAMAGSWWNPDQAGFPWVVSDASNWVFAGTGLKNGDSLPGLVGYEYDKVYSNYPRPQGLQILATSPVVDIYKTHDISNATLYTARSGARVFNAGTIEWSWGLDSGSSIESQLSHSRDSNLVNKSAQQITANILQNFLDTTSTVQDSRLDLKVAILCLIVILSLLYLVYWTWELVAAIARSQGTRPPIEYSHSDSPWIVWSSRFKRRTILVGFAMVGGSIAWRMLFYSTQARSSSTQARSKSLLGTNFYTYRGHHGRVTSTAWSPNGRRIASGSKDSTAQLWDASTGKNSLVYNHGSTNAVAWSPDGKYIASASDDGTIQVWDAVKGSPVFTYRGHSGAVYSVAWVSSGKYLASGGADKTVQVWDTISGQTIMTYYGHSKEVSAVAWSPNGVCIASASFDHTVQVWDAKSGHRISIHAGHSGAVYSVAWAPNGKYLASGGHDYWPRVWDAANGATIYTYGGHRDQVNTVAWSPDGNRIASGSSDHTVQVWDAYTGHDGFTYGGHSGSVDTLAWAPNGQYITSGGDDSTVQVWQAV